MAKKNTTESKMKASVFVETAKKIVKDYKTLYVMGCIGSPLTKSAKKRAIASYSYNRKPAREKLITEASSDTFGFDCVCLIKSILWGWNGDLKAEYGGAVYQSNGVPDEGATTFFEHCPDKTSNFDMTLDAGELLWTTGHIGIYIGGGLAVECTPSWKDKVQITAVGNIQEQDGYPTRKWLMHGHCPYIDYDTQGKIQVGSWVRIKPKAHPYGLQTYFASWVYTKVWVVKSIKGDRVVVDKDITGNYSICSAVNINDLILIQ